MDTLAFVWQWYGKDTLFAVLGLVGGGFISFFFYRRSLQRTEVSFGCEYTRLIWSRIPAFSGITLFQKGRQLHDPRRVIFYIWNSGNTTIHGSMIATADPLRLQAGDVEVINAAIIKTTRDVICAVAELAEDGDVRISFDYLDAGDGFVIEILYDIVKSSSPSNTCPEIFGTIKGFKGPPINRPITFENKAIKRFGQSVAAIVLLLVSSLLLVFQLYEIGHERNWLLIAPKLLTAALLLLLTIGMITTLVYTLRSCRIPMHLKIQDDLDSLRDSYIETQETIEDVNKRLLALEERPIAHN